MDGFELIDRVRANQVHADLPIVVVTGSTVHISDRLRGRGVNAIFPKPYSPAVVREKLEQLSEMKSNSTDFRWGIVLAALMLVGSAATQGQSAPPLPQSQAQQILDRLDRLEKDNQALLEEIRALRLELSVLKSPVESSGVQLPQTADERQNVEENRVAELAQTKVEASQKYPIRITGMALFNASVNGRYNGNAENPLVASVTPGDETGGGTFRQSTLGLLFNGPQTFLGGQSAAQCTWTFSAAALRRSIIWCACEPPRLMSTGKTPVSWWDKTSRSYLREIRIHWLKSAMHR